MTEIANYCTCFIDLLGQQAKLQGQGLLPEFKTQEEKEHFDTVLMGTIGAIERLQRSSTIMRKALIEKDPSKPRYQALSVDEKILFDDMTKHVAIEQRWSDGLVYFASLAESHSKCPMNAVIDIFFSAGSLCLIGLACEVPLRGGIDIAWGVELNPGELYGAALANAYNIESKEAKYPRVVVSQQTVDYLKVVMETEVNGDRINALNSQLALRCLSYLIKDYDGNYIIDHLGDAFVSSFMSTGADSELFFLAEKFIKAQIAIHSENNNAKLLNRYHQLNDYFNSYAYRYRQ
jgi:hypothetical protein